MSMHCACFYSYWCVPKQKHQYINASLLWDLSCTECFLRSVSDLRAGEVCRTLSFKRSWVCLSGSNTKPSCVWWTEEGLLYRRKLPHTLTECVKTEMSSVLTQVCTHLCVCLRASCPCVCVCVQTRCCFPVQIPLSDGSVTWLFSNCAWFVSLVQRTAKVSIIWWYLDKLVKF